MTRFPGFCQEEFSSRVAENFGIARLCVLNGKHKPSEQACRIRTYLLVKVLNPPEDGRNSEPHDVDSDIDPFVGVFGVVETLDDSEDASGFRKMLDDEDGSGLTWRFSFDAREGSILSKSEYTLEDLLLEIVQSVLLPKTKPGVLSAGQTPAMSTSLSRSTPEPLKSGGQGSFFLVGYMTENRALSFDPLSSYAVDSALRGRAQDGASSAFLIGNLLLGPNQILRSVGPREAFPPPFVSHLLSKVVAVDPAPSAGKMAYRVAGKSVILDMHTNTSADEMKMETTLVLQEAMLHFLIDGMKLRFRWYSDELARVASRSRTGSATEVLKNIALNGVQDFEDYYNLGLLRLNADFSRSLSISQQLNGVDKDHRSLRDKWQLLDSLVEAEQQKVERRLLLVTALGIGITASVGTVTLLLTIIGRL
ncbi:MAG: hypothetical protein JRN54_08425 [Nitrososphaerota archaeon]|nr:hypothetical protein [Nitrososphaerota archaeon]